MPDTPDGFQLDTPMRPAGDQPAAIESLARGLRAGDRHQTLMGVTGSGKTFTMANVIAAAQKPALIISHNKTLAAQLYEEFHELFPRNAVSYFVSYYDYYQPEAYIPQRDIYIEKDASRNDDLDRLRLAATTNLMMRRDVVIVASVSCIFGLGSPEEYKKQVIRLDVGQTLDRQDLLHRLNDLQYNRNDIDFKRGTYRVRGDVVEVHPAYERFAVRVELFGDQLEALRFIDPLTGEVLSEDQRVFLYPAVHYVMPEDRMAHAMASIQQELDQRVLQLRHEGKLLEAQRLLARTKYDMEMMKEVGYCSGIENYSRHLDGRAPGEKPYTLLDYFPPDDWLLFIDESHATIPQLRAMYNGDKQRKQVLVDHGFRLPSALDNRPLKFEEFETASPQTIYVSATPGPYELQKTGGVVVEQVIRPTGLVDPAVEVRPATGQVAEILTLAQERAQRGERTLVNTLTKRLAEDLSTYLHERGLRCRYLHSDIVTLDRVAILKELRQGAYDVLVGVNLLREGLDLPEVSLVCILDADKAGFLRSETSMIQQMGRAARNVNAMVVLFADSITPAMRKAMDETDRRRNLQMAYNMAHQITPETIRKSIREGLEHELRAQQIAREAVGLPEERYDREELLALLEKEMLEAAEALEFEKAAALRDRIKEIKDSPEISNLNSEISNLNSEISDSPNPKPGTPGGKHKTTKQRSSR